MLSKVYCAGCSGLDVTTVTVEVEVSDGISFFLVGLADNAVKESQQRIASALKRYGYRMPGKKVVVNMAPANLRKEGSAFDAAIAIGMIAACGQMEQEWLGDFIIMGELALDGSLRPVKGALPIAVHAAREGFKGCIFPKESAQECAEVEGTTIFAAESLGDIIEILSAPDSASSKIPLRQQYIPKTKWDFDFADVKGQALAKKGLEIAAAGGHNVILTGSPGSGKTFMAKCLPSIPLPILWYMHYIEGTYNNLDETAPAVSGTVKVTRTSDIKFVPGGIDEHQMPTLGGLKADFKLVWELYDDAVPANKISGEWSGPLTVVTSAIGDEEEGE